MELEKMVWSIGASAVAGLAGLLAYSAIGSKHYASAAVIAGLYLVLALASAWWMFLRQGR